MIETERQHDPKIEEGRRIAFVIQQAERSLGISGIGGLKDRLTAILEAAMLNPKSIEPGAYKIAYLLWDNIRERSISSPPKSA